MTSPSNSPDTTRPAASDAVKQSHADDRWSRGITEAANRSAMGRRSAAIIGSVIAVGVIAWLIVMLL